MRPNRTCQTRKSRHRPCLDAPSRRRPLAGCGSSATPASETTPPRPPTPSPSRTSSARPRSPPTRSASSPRAGSTRTSCCPSAWCRSAVAAATSTTTTTSPGSSRRPTARAFPPSRATPSTSRASPRPSPTSSSPSTRPSTRRPTTGSRRSPPPSSSPRTTPTRKPLGTSSFSPPARRSAREDQAQKLVDQVNAKFAEAKAAHPEFAGKTLVSDFTSEANAHYLIGKGDPRNAIFDGLGFDAQDTVGDVSEEKLSLLDGNVLFVNGLTKEQMADVPAFQRLNVVRDGRTLYAGSDSTLSGALAFSGPNAHAVRAGSAGPAAEQRGARASRSRTCPTPDSQRRW